MMYWIVKFTTHFMVVDTGAKFIFGPIASSAGTGFTVFKKPSSCWLAQPHASGKSTVKSKVMVNVLNVLNNLG